MAMYVENRRFADEAEPVGLLTEGAAGIATIVLAIIALAGISAGALASIATIVIGVGLMVQAFNSAAEGSKMMTAEMAASQHTAAFGCEVMVDLMCGLTGVVLGILALVGISTAYLVPAALIVFGGALLLSGAISMRPRTFSTATSAGQTQTVSYQGSAAASGIEVLIGLAAVVLGILSVIFAATVSWVLVLVGFIAVGAALLLVSATVSNAMLRLFATA
jgi:hypothetical protein